MSIWIPGGGAGGMVSVDCTTFSLLLLVLVSYFGSWFMILNKLKFRINFFRIMMQITQEVCRHSGLNRSGFTLPGIFIPTLARNLFIQKQVSSTSAAPEKSAFNQVSYSLYLLIILSNIWIWNLIKCLTRKYIIKLN